jgi:hypothetical protein
MPVVKMARRKIILDDFDFGIELWGSGTGIDPYSIAMPPGYTFRVCFNQDNGIVACYDGSEDGTFGGVDPNVVVDGDFTLNPLTVTPGIAINGTVDNLDPYQHLRVFAHSDAGTPEDGSDDFSMSDSLDADDSGVVHYSLTVPGGYSFIVEFQPEYLPNAYYLSSDVNGTNDPNMATVIVADGDLYGVDLTLPAKGSIAGRVLSDGEPVSGLWVEVFAEKCWDTWLNGGRTDDQGFYTVDRLPVGDVYVNTCAGCDNKNYIDRWYTSAGGSEDCNQAEPVVVNESAVTELIDFDLERGPQRERWTEVSVYDGILGVGFDLQPGFDSLIVSATLYGPDGLFYEFDLQSDTFQWLNDCYFNPIMWWKDLSQGEDIEYGEYQLTLGFRDGYEKTYIHNLQNVTIAPVNPASMSYVVNEDGSIDFTFTNPDLDLNNPSQWHRVMIYNGDDRLLSMRVPAQMTSLHTLHVGADQLRCLEIGASYSWHIRAHDLNEPYNVTYKTYSPTPLTYNPSSLDNRVTNFWLTHAISQNELWLYFNTRPGSQNDITHAMVTGPNDFSYTFDLVDDWFDLSTETRILNGWNKAISLPVSFGQYALNVQFNEGPPENKTFYLPEVTVVPVDASTIRTYILENGAGYCTWELPAGVTGQYYQVRIRSTDGFQEFYASNSERDGTSRYASPWELRGMVPGESYQLFVRAYDEDFKTMAQSESVVSVFDAFGLFPPVDTNKDWDVDGSDLAAVAQFIQDGLIDNVNEAVEQLAQRFGKLQ